MSLHPYTLKVYLGYAVMPEPEGIGEGWRWHLPGVFKSPRTFLTQEDAWGAAEERARQVDWGDVVHYFGIDTSFWWSDSERVCMAEAYLDSLAAESRSRLIVHRLSQLRKSPLDLDELFLLIEEARECWSMGAE